MPLPSLAEIHAAQTVVYRHMPPTPQYSWPLLNERLGTEVWIKHENHTPVGAFKLRGALVYLDWLKQMQPRMHGVVAATRGNHGQGVGMAARLLGLKAVIVVPHGNSADKNRAMKAQGVELVEHGGDFQESLEFAQTLAAERGLTMIDSYHERLVRGTATHALELFQGAPALDIVYVPIGLGSSICGIAAARNALGLSTAIAGVVSAETPAYALSFRQRRAVEAPARTAIADGLACRVPNREALETILENVACIVEVTDEEMMDAMRIYFDDTHNAAEGAGAAALAGAMKEKDSLRGKRVGIVLSGGNVDRKTYAAVLGGAHAAAGVRLVWARLRNAPAAGPEGDRHPGQSRPSTPEASLTI
ncbi:MAG: threonine dehydratase [Acidobacteriota bacterium]|nr:threonine dehydratase [Acidobacteriota bacterium]